MKCLGSFHWALKENQLWWKGIPLGWTSLVGAEGLCKPRTGRQGWVCVCLLEGVGGAWDPPPWDLWSAKRNPQRHLLSKCHKIEDLKLPNVTAILFKFYPLQKTFTFLTQNCHKPMKKPKQGQPPYFICMRAGRRMGSMNSGVIHPRFKSWFLLSLVTKCKLLNFAEFS